MIIQENPHISQVSAMKLNVVENLGICGSEGVKYILNIWCTLTLFSHILKKNLLLTGRVGNVIRSDLEHVLNDLSQKNQSVELYITNNVKGFLISGNHRFAVKEWVRQNNTELFLKEPYWNLTLTQLFIGLSPDQARFLAKVDNEKERVQASDTMSSEIKVHSLSINC